MRNFLILLVFVMAISFIQAGTPSAQDIMVKADKKRCGDDWKFQITVYEYKGKKTPTSTNVYAAQTRMFKNGVSKCFVDFLAPKAVKGQKMLRDGRVYWMSFPGTKNIVRITASQTLAGQATAADIAATNFANDYKAKLIGSGKVGKKACYKLKLTGMDETLAYQKLIYWVSKKGLNPLRVKYYSASGKLLKIGYYRRFKPIAKGSKVVKAHELFIVDPLKKKHVTRMIYKKVVKSKAPEYIFTKDNL